MKKKREKSQKMMGRLIIKAQLTSYTKDGGGGGWRGKGGRVRQRRPAFYEISYLYYP